MSRANYETDEDYFAACRDERIAAGHSREQAQHDYEMYLANGEEFEGQYAGRDGWGASG